MLHPWYLHLDGVGEQVAIPGEVLFAIGVLNVEPQHIVGDVMLLHTIGVLRSIMNA